MEGNFKFFIRKFGEKKGNFDLSGRKIFFCSGNAAKINEKESFYVVIDHFESFIEPKVSGVPGNLTPPPKYGSPGPTFLGNMPPGPHFLGNLPPPLQTWMLNNFVRVQRAVNVSILLLLYIIQRTYANIQTISDRF